MIRFDVRLLVSWLQHIEEFEDALLSGALYGGAHELTASRSPDELLTIDGRKWLWAQLGPLQEHLEPLALSVGKIEIQYLWNHANKWSGKEMAARLKDFRSKLERELNHRFSFILLRKKPHNFGRLNHSARRLHLPFPLLLMLNYVKRQSASLLVVIPPAYFI
jgi:hypothetical protein